MLINNTKPDNDNYLDINKLELDRRYKKVSFVQNISENIAKNMSGFFTFYLKDCNGNIITGRMFDLNNFIEIGQKIRMLKGSPVEIEFYVQELNGSLTLNLIGIDIYNGAFDNKKFLGVIDNLDMIREGLQGIEDYDKILNANLTDFYGGRVGGFALFCYSILEEVKLQEKYNICNFKVLEESAKFLLPLLFKYYRLIEINPVLDPGTIIATANSAIIMQNILSDSSILSDVYLACCGLIKPQYLESKILYNIVIKNKEALDLASISKTMSIGATKRLDDGSVLKRI